jgi:hypothetical protein
MNKPVMASLNQRPRHGGIIMFTKAASFLKPRAITWVLLFLLYLVLPIVIGNLLPEMEPAATVGWLFMVTMLLVCYVLSAALTRFLAQKLNLTSLFRIYMTALFIGFILTFAASGIISKNYWGYYFFRPDVLREVSQVKGVTRITQVMAERQGKSKNYRFKRVYGFWHHSNHSITQGAQYDNPEIRVTSALGERLTLPGLSERMPPELADMYPILKASGALIPSESGYDSLHGMLGLIAETVTHDGRKLVFMGLRGRETSNDHYPYYELIFEKKGSKGKPEFIRGQWFFFDIAGFEGTEWFVMWLFFFLLASILCLPIALICCVARHLSHRRGESC